MSSICLTKSRAHSLLVKVHAQFAIVVYSLHQAKFAKRVAHERRQIAGSLWKEQSPSPKQMLRAAIFWSKIVPSSPLDWARFMDSIRILGTHCPTRRGKPSSFALAINPRTSQSTRFWLDPSWSSATVLASKKSCTGRGSGHSCTGWLASPSCSCQ